MIKLELGNVFLKVSNAPKLVEDDLWNIFSFKVEVYGSDNTIIRHLYNRKTKTTYAGLVDPVLKYLKEKKYEYILNDMRIVPKQNANFKLVKYIDDKKTIALESRPYQQEIIDNAGPREIIQAATGAGKTYIMAALIAKINVKPVNVFATTLTLCAQLKDEFEKFLGEEIGLVGGGFNDRRDITVFSIQSVTEEDAKNAKVIIYDECHHIGSDTCMKVSNNSINAYYRIGVSATPWRDSGDDLLIEAAINKKKTNNIINASKLIKLGYLVKPDIYLVPIKQTFKGKNYNDIYKKAIVYNNFRNNAIVKIATQMNRRNKKILILIKNIKHGEEIQKMLFNIIEEKITPVVVKHPKSNKDVTIRVKNIEFLSGSDNAVRRKAVIEAVKSGICKILIASTIADEGLDLPILDCLILAQAGKSSTRAFQRVGRVLRLYKDKVKALVFDFVDYTPMLRRHSRIREKLYMQEELWELKNFDVRLIE